MGKIRLIIMFVIAGLSVFSFFSKTSVNPITGESQRISLTKEQEVAMGLQAAPEMAAQFGGLSTDERIQQRVKALGKKIVALSIAAQSGYPFDFHVLADDQTVNAFALPGGQIFITLALLSRLKTEDQLAGVIGHEIGHVIGRHSAEHIAKQELTQGLTGAVVMGSGSYEIAQVTRMVGGLINMKYGRGDELEADKFGMCFIKDAGYDPAELVDVMKILADASGGAPSAPEFASTHPAPENRMQQIEEHLQNLGQVCTFSSIPQQ